MKLIEELRKIVLKYRAARLPKLKAKWEKKLRKTANKGKYKSEIFVEEIDYEMFCVWADENELKRNMITKHWVEVSFK